MVYNSTAWRCWASWALVAGASAVLLGSLVLEAQRTLSAHYLLVDWRTYAAAFDRLAQGASLYDPRQLHGPYDLPSVTLTGYAYPPVAALLFAPFASVPLGLATWIALNVGLVLAGLAAAIHSAFGRVRPEAVAFALIALSVFPPFREGVAVGNINVGFSGLLALAWASGRTAGWLGPVSGLAAALKVFPGSLVAWAGPGYRTRALLSATLVGAALVLVTLPLVGGAKSWEDWLTALGNAQPACARWSNLLPSIACSLSPYVGSDVAKLLGGAVGATLALAALLTNRTQLSLALLTAAWLAPVIDMDPYYLLTPFVVGLALLFHRFGRASSRAVSPVPQEAEGDRGG